MGRTSTLHHTPGSVVTGHSLCPSLPTSTSGYRHRGLRRQTPKLCRTGLGTYHCPVPQEQPIRPGLFSALHPRLPHSPDKTHLSPQFTNISLSDPFSRATELRDLQDPLAGAAAPSSCRPHWQHDLHRGRICRYTPTLVLPVS